MMLPISDTLLVIDFQNGVCKEPQDIFNIQECVTGINSRITAYRHAHKPIIFFQHNDEELIFGSFLWKIIPEIDSQPNDNFIQKTHANSFYHTKLRKLLNENDVRSIEICGAQTEFCVDTTIKMAHGLGYELQMKKAPKSSSAIIISSTKTSVMRKRIDWKNLVIDVIFIMLNGEHSSPHYVRVNLNFIHLFF